MIKKLSIMVFIISMIVFTIYGATALTIEKGVWINSSSKTNLTTGEETTFDNLIINNTGIWMDEYTLGENSYDVSTGNIVTGIDYLLKKKKNYNTSNFVGTFDWESNSVKQNDVIFGNLTGQGAELRIFTLTMNEGAYLWETSGLPAQFATEKYGFQINHTNQTDYTYQLSAKAIQFAFYQNNAPINTTWKITDVTANEVLEQNTTSYFNYTLDFEDGKIHLLFGLGNSVYNFNYTQQYQFLKVEETNINENLTILRKADGYTFVQVYDRGATVKNAKVRVWGEDPENHTSEESYQLVGQYLTDEIGKTSEIFIDKRATYYFEVIKDGYTTVKSRSYTGNELHLETKRIEIQTSELDKLGIIQVAVRKYFTNRSLNIYGQIFAPNANNISIQTKYRNESGWGNTTEYLTEIDLRGEIGKKIWLFTLTPNTHINPSGNSNITLYVWIDNIYTGSITIEYVGAETYVEVAPPSDLEDDIPKGALIIFIIFSTLMTGMIFRSQNAGQMGFIGSTIIAGIINPILFLLLLIIGIKYTANYLRKMRSDE